MSETYALVDRVPDLVGADIESAVGQLVLCIPGENVSQIVHAGGPGADKDGAEEDTVAADESAFRDVSIRESMVVRGSWAHTCRDRRERQTSCR